MQIGDYRYFAPGIKVHEVKLDAPGIVRQYQTRIEGYYIQPAHLLASKQSGFGAVALLAAALDALARFERPHNETNRKRYIAWTKDHVPSLKTEPLATQFYDDFRCGVLHEGRATSGCVFVPDMAYTIRVEGTLMGVNPEKFAEEISHVLEAFCTRTEGTPELLQRFQARLKEDFAKDLTSAILISPTGH